MELIYKCSKCPKTFTDKNKGLIHEAEHDNTLSDCPDCDGNGWYYGTDGIDCSTCYTCKGLGKVILTARTITISKSII